MKVWRYSRWDGSQPEFSLDPDAVLDALSDLMMEGLSAEEALAWMQRAGFDLAGQGMRVLGVEELLDELRRELQNLERRYRMDEATADPRRRLDEILDREECAQRTRHGYESQRMNEFLDRRHAPAAKVSDAIERFRDWEFADAEAGEQFRELLDELGRTRKLEEFLAKRGDRFRGQQAADYETAQQIRERIEALEQLARDLANGNFQTIDPQQLRELLAENALRSLLLLRDLRASLDRAGYLRGGDDVKLSARAIRRIGAQALATVYGALRKGRPGGHDTVRTGVAIPRPDETRPWQFGDAFNVDVVKSLLNAVNRNGTSTPIAWSPEDLEVREMDYQTNCTTVLLLDMSWSMCWAGRFPAAKRVAIALDHLIRTRYPRDHFFVVGFSTRAREIRVHDLPEASWNAGEPFTNLQEGLMLAERLIARNPSPSAQVLVITDGQPTAYFQGRELHVEWPSGFGGVSPRAVAETLKQVRRITSRGVTINTFMLDASPELVSFVESMTRINKGRALYTQPSRLGSYVMVDYLSRRRTLRR